MRCSYHSDDSGACPIESNVILLLSAPGEILCKLSANAVRESSAFFIFNLHSMLCSSPSPPHLFRWSSVARRAAHVRIRLMLLDNSADSRCTSRGASTIYHLASFLVYTGRTRAGYHADADAARWSRRVPFYIYLSLPRRYCSRRSSYSLRAEVCRHKLHMIHAGNEKLEYFSIMSLPRPAKYRVQRAIDVSRHSDNLSRGSLVALGCCILPRLFG